MRGEKYRPAWWVPGAHFRTIWGKLVPRAGGGVTRIERWDTPDDDFLDIYRLDAPARAPHASPRLVVLHGLEGSPDSHYARSFLHEATRRGWAADVVVFRSCGSELNRAKRFYHSGETTDLDFVVRSLAENEPGRPIVLAGVSLGGNVLLKWLGESAGDIPPEVMAAAAISVPFDLERGARHIDRGFARVYQARFLKTLRRKARAKLLRFPGLVDAAAVERARSLYDFDDCVTAPVHGFDDAHDYYSQSSSLRWIDRIRTPTLLLSARDDPFLPPEVLDEVARIADGNPYLTTEFVERGGHAGFISGRFPWKPFYYAEWRATEFLEERAARARRESVVGESPSP
ncbi:MAG TPA: hydrolase [Gemmatimonadaceae bacterium]